MTGTSDRREASKLERSNAILDAATRLFGELGYGTTTTDQIADRAKVTKKTLYRYTGSKEKILLLIHGKFLDAADAVREAWTSGSAEERLRLLVSAYLQVVVDNQDAIRVFFEEMKKLSPESRATVVERRDAFESSVRELIADGVSDQEFRNADVPLTAWAILGGLANCYRWYSPKGNASPGEIAKIASDLFLNGLSVSAKPENQDNGKKSSASWAGFLVTNAESEDLSTTSPPPSSIMKAGIDLFVEKGYLETSTREIAARAGVTKSALFYHIGSKEELLFAIHEEFGRNRLVPVADLLNGTAPQDVVEVLGQFIVTHCEIMDMDQKVVEIFTDQSRYLEGEHREHIARIRDLYAAALQQIIEFGVENGTFKTSNPQVTTLIIIGTLNSMYRWYQPGGRLSAKQIGEEFTTLILDGLLSP